MVRVMDLYKVLPGLNCGKCGEETCMSFAMKLLQGNADWKKCTPILEEKHKDKKKQLEKLMSNRGKAAETGLIIHEDKCTGCGNCVIACPVAPMNCPSAIGGKGPQSTDVVLKVVDGKCKVVNLKKCRRSGEDKRCRICADACPFDAIEFV